MGNVKSGTEPSPGWVPGPNPFGDQRACNLETWHRVHAGVFFDLRLDFFSDKWQITKMVKRNVVNRLSLAVSSWTTPLPVGPGFADPVGAMLWFELNKEEL